MELTLRGESISVTPLEGSETIYVVRGRNLKTPRRPWSPDLAEDTTDDDDTDAPVERMEVDFSDLRGIVSYCRNLRLVLKRSIDTLVLMDRCHALVDVPGISVIYCYEASNLCFSSPIRVSSIILNGWSFIDVNTDGTEPTDISVEGESRVFFHGAIGNLCISGRSTFDGSTCRTCRIYAKDRARVRLEESHLPGEWVPCKILSYVSGTAQIDDSGIINRHFRHVRMPIQV